VCRHRSTGGEAGGEGEHFEHGEERYCLAAPRLQTGGFQLDPFYAG